MQPPTPKPDIGEKPLEEPGADTSPQGLMWQPEESRLGSGVCLCEGDMLQGEEVAEWRLNAHRFSEELTAASWGQENLHISGKSPHLWERCSPAELGMRPLAEI